MKEVGLHFARAGPSTLLFLITNNAKETFLPVFSSELVWKRVVSEKQLLYETEHLWGFGCS